MCRHTGMSMMCSYVSVYYIVLHLFCSAVITAPPPNTHTCHHFISTVAVSTPEYLNRFRSGFILISMIYTVKNDFDADPF